MEIDLLLENDDTVILIEVKTTLKVEHVREFRDKLKRFLKFSPKYGQYKIYGAVAGVHIEGGVDRFAYQQGLFVLGVVGEGMGKILNDLELRPKDFCGAN